MNHSGGFLEFGICDTGVRDRLTLNPRAFNVNQPDARSRNPMHIPVAATEGMGVAVLLFFMTKAQRSSSSSLRIP